MDDVAHSRVSHHVDFTDINSTHALSTPCPPTNPKASGRRIIIFISLSLSHNNPSLNVIFRGAGHTCEPRVHHGSSIVHRPQCPCRSPLCLPHTPTHLPPTSTGTLCEKTIHFERKAVSPFLVAALASGHHHPWMVTRVAKVWPSVAPSRKGQEEGKKSLGIARAVTLAGKMWQGARTKVRPVCRVSIVPQIG
ncbi:hypothetical protein P691DRAFT_126672 [Macrolepiota fuliginosa MF-IS2]|uniref:Uncharacterized protein n=1 Tax=Macrolepiota fuliginosa MF-IS2 TaxID=1400762 RepID=A0A9P6BW31_9AGAR|nr:hypothetical protein P691DRAFT_126672 [Macrolepiota fuliginosa MF-IS2]